MKHVQQKLPASQYTSYRKSNRGSQILQFLEEKAKEQGIRQLFVLTTVPPTGS